MYLNIGEQRVTLTVPYSRRDFVRRTESSVDALYRKWHKSFPDKSDRELLAMVAYQYASFYVELKERRDKADALARECLSILQEPETTPEEDIEEDF